MIMETGRSQALNRHSAATVRYCGKTGHYCLFLLVLNVKQEPASSAEKIPGNGPAGVRVGRLDGPSMDLSKKCKNRRIYAVCR